MRRGFVTTTPCRDTPTDNQDIPPNSPDTPSDSLDDTIVKKAKRANYPRSYLGPDGTAFPVYQPDRQQRWHLQGQNWWQKQKAQVRLRSLRQDYSSAKRIWVDNEVILKEALRFIHNHATERANNLYIDAEGRHMTLLNIYLHGSNRVYFFDIQTLGRRAFEGGALKDGTTLGSLLSNWDIRKIFFARDLAVKNLAYRYQIRLQGVEDIQLLEFETKKKPEKWKVSGLSEVFLHTLPKFGLKPEEVEEILSRRRAGKNAIIDKRGGTEDALVERPLPPFLEDYLVNDVLYLHHLWVHFRELVSPESRKMCTIVANKPVALHGTRDSHRTAPPELLGRDAHKPKSRRGTAHDKKLHKEDFRKLSPREEQLRKQGPTRHQAMLTKASKKRTL